MSYYSGEKMSHVNKCPMAGWLGNPNLNYNIRVKVRRFYLINASKRKPKQQPQQQKNTSMKVPDSVTCTVHNTPPIHKPFETSLL
jgi:hypothetical protein